jgi:hypothetical protein
MRMATNENNLMLQAGGIYFIVTFEDAALTIPIIRTVRFEEVRSTTDGKGLACFTQLQGTDFEILLAFDADEVADSVMDGNGLLALLTRCFAGELDKKGRTD